MKFKSSRIGEITLPFTDIGKLSPCRQLSMSKICVLTHFAKINIFRKHFRIYSSLASSCYLGVQTPPLIVYLSIEASALKAGPNLHL